MTEISAVEVDRFHAGTRILMRVSAPGTFFTQSKDGLVELAYGPGDVLLADGKGDVIVPPMSVEGVADMAARILDGDQRTITDPLAILALAAAFLGLAVPPPLPPEVMAQAAAREALHG